MPKTHSIRALFIPLLIIALLAMIAGCARNSTPSEPSDGPAESWQKAMNLFQRERYRRAQEVLRDIVLNYSGSSIIDSAQFYLARTSYELEDFIVAADEFHRVVDQYPSSPLVGAANYWEGRCYLAQSPPYQLDQEDTEKAIQAFQRYLEEYPSHELADSGYYYLAQARQKLSTKVLASAELYFKLREMASAVLYADAVLENYYDTPQAEQAQLLKARSYQALANWERAAEEYRVYLEKYPTGKSVERVRDLLKAAERNAGSGVGVVTP